MDNVGNKEDDRQEGGGHSLPCMSVTLDTSHFETSPLLQQLQELHDCATVWCTNSRFCVRISSKSLKNRILASSLPADMLPPVFLLLLFWFFVLFILFSFFIFCCS